jgi:hypothetical protein
MQINYLCSYDLYSPVHNVVDACIPLRGQAGGGWALVFESFLRPVKWHRADRRVPFGAQNTERFNGEGCTCKVEPVHCLPVYPAEDPDVAGVGHHLNQVSHKRGALPQKQLPSIHIDMLVKENPKQFSSVFFTFYRSR